MKCEEVPRVIDAYLDGELSVAVTLEAHEHFTVCPSCRRILESEAALHGLLVQASRAEPGPPGLRHRVLESLGQAAPVPGRPGYRRAVKVGVVAGCVGLAALGLLALLPIPPQPMSPLAAELASKHLLYGGGHGGTLELVTSEPARLGGWFHERLRFPVRLPSAALTSERLIGGRVSSVADSPAAYALYDRSGQPISLFVTRRVPFARRGWTERQVDGTELYLASLQGVSLVWWEDKQADRLYAAAWGGDEDSLIELARKWRETYHRSSAIPGTGHIAPARFPGALPERKDGSPGGHLRPFPGRGIG